MIYAPGTSGRGEMRRLVLPVQARRVPPLQDITQVHNRLLTIATSLSEGHSLESRIAALALVHFGAAAYSIRGLLMAPRQKNGERPPLIANPEYRSAWANALGRIGSVQRVLLEKGRSSLRPAEASEIERTLGNLKIALMAAVNNREPNAATLPLTEPQRKALVASIVSARLAAARALLKVFDADPEAVELIADLQNERGPGASLLHEGAIGVLSETGKTEAIELMWRRLWNDNLGRERTARVSGERVLSFCRYNPYVMKALIANTRDLDRLLDFARLCSQRGFILWQNQSGEFGDRVAGVFVTLVEKLGEYRGEGQAQKAIQALCQYQGPYKERILQASVKAMNPALRDEPGAKLFSEPAELALTDYIDYLVEHWSALNSANPRVVETAIVPLRGQAA